MAAGIVHQLVIGGAGNKYRPVVTGGLRVGVGMLGHLVVEVHLVAKSFNVGVVLPGFGYSVGALGAAVPHGSARAQKHQTVRVQLGGGGSCQIAAHAVAAQKDAVIVRKGLCLYPGKDIGNVGVQTIKSHVSETAVTFAVAVIVKPCAADALCG